MIWKGEVGSGAVMQSWASIGRYSTTDFVSLPVTGYWSIQLFQMPSGFDILFKHMYPETDTFPKFSNLLT